MRTKASSLADIEAVYRRDYPRLLRFAVAMLGDVERGRDAVHEAFVRAIHSLGGFRGEGGLESWLWQILVNVCRAEKRLREPAFRLADETPPDEPADWADVRAAVALLPEQQRLTLFLRHYADLDYEQIVAVLDVARGTVAATLHAAHARLRESLGEVRT